jgi:iron complex outermembrane recepter protein
MRKPRLLQTWSALAASGLLLCAAGALAQDAPETGAAPAPSKERVEEVVITGSRIARTNLEGLGPITQLSSEDIELSGVQTVDELLRELPSVGFQGISQNNNNGGGGLRFVELRNLQPQRTLVLVNGRRFVTNGSGTNEAVDINNVPTALIERIDVLRDGVSTIYGSDAVAGVINFVLKDDFEGFQAEIIGGIADELDGEEAGANFVWGKNGSRSNLTLSGAVFSREEVLARDRDFSRFPLTRAEFINNDPAQGYRETVGSGFIPEGRVLGPDNVNRFFREDPATGASFSRYNAFRRGDAYNFSEKSFLVPEQVRYIANASYRYELTDSLEFFAEGEYAMRNSQQELAPVPAGSTATRGQPNGITFPIFRDSSRNNPFLPQDFVDETFRLAGSAAGDSTTITFNKRFLESANRIYTQDSRTQRLVAGFRGELEGFFGPLDWEIFGNYGRNQSTEFIDNQINLTRAIASLQPELCAQTPGCVVGDFFGRGALNNTPQALEFIRYESRDRLGFHLREVGGTIGGTAFNVPAGEVKLVLGAEYRQEDGFVNPDFLTVSGDSSGNGLDPTRGSFITRSAFWESNIPVLTGLPFAEDFTLEISGRYTDYSSFGGKYLSRYGFSWAPSSELRLRGVFATSFRAPGISDLFGGGADAFPALIDPCNNFPNISDPILFANCAADLPDNYTADNPFSQNNIGGGGQLRANVGGNPELTEEEADTLNFGIVYQPSFLPDLDIAVDYFRVEIDTPIVNREPQRVLDNCYRRGDGNLGAPDCANVDRSDLSGGVNLIRVAKQNVGKIETSGIDFQVDYGFELPLLGPTSATIGGSYVFDFATTDEGGKVKTNGVIEQNNGAIPNFKMRIGTRFQPMDNLSLSTTARLIGSAVDRNRHENFLPFDHVPRIWYVDTSARYSLSENYDLTFGVRNIADKRPPIFIDAGSNTNLNTYDVLGRFVFARFTASF